MATKKELFNGPESDVFVESIKNTQKEESAAQAKLTGSPASRVRNRIEKDDPDRVIMAIVMRKSERTLLKRYADEQGTDASDIVRQWIHQYCEEKK